MIRIEKGYLNAPCNTCGADTDITLLIRYKHNSGGIGINLCDDCRKGLIEKLKEYEQNDNTRND